MGMFRNWASWRRLRYAVFTLAAVAPVWFFAISYIMFSTPKYEAGMTLILPGEGPTASLTLDEVGQASTHSSSPWSSSRLSPVESYRKLMMTDTVRRRAAEARSLTKDEFPKPKIKLVDQTNLMMISLRGLSKDGAEGNAVAFLDAFNAELTILRQDYISRRETANREAIRGYKNAVTDAQQAILDFRTSTGLTSPEQYTETLALITNLEVRNREIGAELGRLSGEVTGLETSLRTSAPRAAAALKLRADPVFQAMLDDAGALKIEYEKARARYGDRHPDFTAIASKFRAAVIAMRSRGRALTGLSPEAFGRADLATRGAREGMLSTLVEADARRTGLLAEQIAMASQLDAARETVLTLAAPSAELDRLMRDHQVAEAVFASALARADTTKTDLFGTYPLAQIVEYPLASDDPVSPNKKIGLIAAIAGTIFIAGGLILAWMRRPILRALGRMFAHPSSDPDFSRQEPASPAADALDDEPLVEIPNQIPRHERYAFEDEEIKAGRDTA